MPLSPQLAPYSNFEAPSLEVAGLVNKFVPELHKGDAHVPIGASHVEISVTAEIKELQTMVPADTEAEELIQNVPVINLAHQVEIAKAQEAEVNGVQITPPEVQGRASIENTPVHNTALQDEMVQAPQVEINELLPALSNTQTEPIINSTSITNEALGADHNETPLTQPDARVGAPIEEMDCDPENFIQRTEMKLGFRYVSSDLWL